MDVTPHPPSAHRIRGLVAALVISLAVAACSSSTSTSTAPSTASTERADNGPTDIDAYIAGHGGNIEASTGDPTGTPAADTCATAYVPDELLVYISTAGRSANTTQTIADAINGALKAQTDLKLPAGFAVGDQFARGNDRQAPSRPVYRIELPAGSGLRSSSVAAINAALRGSIPANDNLAQVATDLDHIGPFLPVGKFSPADAPTPARKSDEDPAQKALAEHRVLVVDYPADPVDAWAEDWTSATNHQADKQVDYVAGHGTFVSDIIEQRAAGTAADLQGVVHPAPTTGDPWPGFLFTEDDLVTAIEAGFAPSPGTTDAQHLPSRTFTKSFEIINFSLGTVDCAGSPHPVLEHVLRDILDPASYTPAAKFSGATYFVAAVGNDGTSNPNRVHFPAAFAALPKGDVLGDHVIAVAATEGSNLAAYSNNACWVNAHAPGTAVAAFPWLHSDKFATWNGTSFATARVTAALAHEAGAVAATWSATAAGSKIGSDAQSTRVGPTCPP